MIQDFMALGVFIAALIFAGISLIRFIVDQVKNNGNNQCSQSCNCKPASTRKFIPGTMENHTQNYKSVKLK